MCLLIVHQSPAVTQPSVRVRVVNGTVSGCYMSAVNHPATSPTPRALIRLALVLWSLAALAAVWEGMAMQAPDSPFHVGVLAGPIGQLRGYTFAVGTGMLGAAWLWPWLYPQGKGRFSLAALILGALLSTAALAYAALHGMIGAQLIDPRPDARAIAVARGAGHVLLMSALFSAALQAFRR
jgi:hypothetical protein